MKIFYIARPNSGDLPLKFDDSPELRAAILEFVEKGLFGSKKEADKNMKFKAWLLKNIKGVSLIEFTQTSRGKTYQFYGIHLRK